MRISGNRILTTHVGSLPRSDELTDVLLRKDGGEADPSGEFDRLISKAVAEVVRRQVDVGVDIPSDGEQGKEQEDFEGAHG